MLLAIRTVFQKAPRLESASDSMTVERTAFQKAPRLESASDSMTVEAKAKPLE